MGQILNYKERYGLLDRVFYRMALRSGTAQRTFADLEETLFRKKLAAISGDNPVFITALPRSGTTILLSILWQSGAFASHTYQDMPFVRSPLIWNHYRRHFSVDDTPRERTHGDGLQISGSSPEAFEEMVWKHYWPDHYYEDRIRPWTREDSNPEFDDGFELHMRKVIAVRQEQEVTRGRYLSKNNLNISRLAGLPKPLRSGTFLIPFRSPAQHAASMLHQHRRFTRLQREDPFMREYMEAIGHHEFGEGLKPVNFGGWLDDAPGSPDGIEFWLRYWIAGYRFVMDNATESVVLVSYARLVGEPESSLERLARVINVDPVRLTTQSASLRPPRTHPLDGEPISSALLLEAEEVHDRLIRHAAV